MSFATTYCRAALGIDAPLVSVETHLANGLPAFNIVGLPEKAVQIGQPDNTPDNGFVQPPFGAGPAFFSGSIGH